MITVRKELGFDAAHRLINHEGKCAHLHGHRYTVYVTVTADSLDKVGRVIDFSVIKDVVGKWIDDQWDHGTIVNFYDDPLIEFCTNNRQKHYCLTENPTAENIAKELHRVASSLLGQFGVRVLEIEVFETPTCSATFRPVEDSGLPIP